MKKTLVDSGPLVAFFSTKDRHHAWAYDQLHALAPPVLTCEPVLTEACFLLRRNGGRPTVILRAVREGIIQVAFGVVRSVAACRFGGCPGPSPVTP